MKLLKKCNEFIEKIRSPKNKQQGLETSYEAIVIGASAGGLQALKILLPIFPKNFPLPIIVVHHVLKDSSFYIADILKGNVPCEVKEACDKQKMQVGHIYFAPPDYHLMIEQDYTFSLSVEDRVLFSRPSIDVLFQSSADVFGKNLIGILLTGANDDGAYGLKEIKLAGGVTIVQDPKTAEMSRMPQAAISLFEVDHILPLKEIGPFALACTINGSTNRIINKDNNNDNIHNDNNIIISEKKEK